MRRGVVLLALLLIGAGLIAWFGWYGAQQAPLLAPLPLISPLPSPPAGAPGAAPEAAPAPEPEAAPAPAPEAGVPAPPAPTAAPKAIPKNGRSGDSQHAGPPVAAVTVDEALQSLREASVAFNAPERARVGRAFTVEAILSTRIPAGELAVMIEEEGRRVSGTLKVSDRMTARLSGGDAFTIVAADPEEQWISDREPTAWHWRVTPAREGAHVLFLSFDALITVNGKEGRRAINTFKHRIDVTVAPPETPLEWLAYIRRMLEDATWLWGTLLLPIGAAVWHWWRQRRRAR